MVIALWLLLLIATVGVNRFAGGTFSDKVELPGTQASTGLHLLEEHERSAGGYTGQVVFHLPSASLASKQPQVQQSVANLRALEHVRSASDPFANGSGAISDDGHIAYSNVSFDERPKTLGQGYIGKLEAATAPARAAGV